MTKTHHIIGLDGTWQRADQDYPSNVYLLLHSIPKIISNGFEQRTQHFDGVGSDGGTLKRTWNGATGADLPKRIKEAYEYYSLNYQSGDKTTLIGYSRGAYTARSLNGMIYKCGVVDWDKAESAYAVDRNNPEHREWLINLVYRAYKSNEKPSSPKMQKFRKTLSINERPETNLACIDTVGSLGVPNRILIGSIEIGLWRPLAKLLNGRKEFYDPVLGRNIGVALQADAIDEHRHSFPVTPMVIDPNSDTDCEELWFVGDHGIGGGNPKTEAFSDEVARWFVSKLQDKTGITFDNEIASIVFGETDINEVSPEAFKMQESIITKLTGLHFREISDTGAYHPSVLEYLEAYRDQYKPCNSSPTLPIWESKLAVV